MRTMPPASEHPRTRSICAAAAALFLALHVLAAVNAHRVDAPLAAPAGHLRLRLDPNKATSAELTLLPGIGPVLAIRIVDFRNAGIPGRTPFSTADDLENVRGVGPKKVAAMREYLRFDPITSTTAQR